MSEPHFSCPFDLFHGIPQLAEPGLSAIDEPHAFTRCFVTSSWSGLARGGRRQAAPALQLPTRDRFDLARLALTREEALDATSMEPWFAPDFPANKFWFMRVRIFAFQPWHGLVEFRRQMPRFTHLPPGDRPQVLLPGTRRLAFVGQSCELPEDSVFTVEYSVRSAPGAVYGLCDPSCAPPPLYRGWRDPHVVPAALRAL
jgi:myosin-crossreactive antigen